MGWQRATGRTFGVTESRRSGGLANRIFALAEPGLDATLANGTISAVNCNGKGIQERGAGRGA